MTALLKMRARFDRIPSGHGISGIPPERRASERRPVLPGHVFDFRPEYFSSLNTHSIIKLIEESSLDRTGSKTVVDLLLERIKIRRREDRDQTAAQI
jgi:hypothetical protein